MEAIELIKLFVFVWLGFSVVNHLIPEIYKLLIYAKKNGLYLFTKAVATTVVSCSKCFFFWVVLFTAQDLFLASSFAFIAQLIGNKL